MIKQKFAASPLSHFGLFRGIRRVLVGVFAGLTLSAVLVGNAVAEPQRRLDVLELFTSQGCSSCPPADALLQKFSKQDDILALSFPVSYWDYLGWKDTLAKDAYNKRQLAYAEARGDRSIYTPQLVVNGVRHVVGSHGDDAKAAIRDTAQMLETASVPVSASQEKNIFRIDIGSAPDGSTYRSGKVWVACYSRSVDVAIARGENTGRKISYTNVVREFVPAGRWDGTETTLTIEIPANKEFDGIAVLLQADKSHAMLGAADVAFHP